MFKNSKDKENNFISTEEAEKMYKFQKKNFDQKIAQQQEKIDELVDFISARFGEEVLNSNIGAKLKSFEISLSEIENNYEENLKRNAKELKKEIEKEGQKIAAKLNDAQTESYFKLLQKNESDMTKIQKYFNEKEEKDEKVLNLDKLVKEHIKDSEAYRKEMQEGLKTANQKIGKISYAGITSKFDKKIKEECANIDEKLEELKKQNKSDISSIDEQLGQIQEHLQANEEETIKLQELFINENEKINKGLENNINRIVVLDERLSEEVESLDEDIKKIEEKANKLDYKLTNELKDINGNLQKSDENVKKLEHKIMEEFNAKIQNNNIQIVNLKEKLSNDILNVILDIKNNEATTTEMREDIKNKITQTRDAINKLKDIAKNKNTKLEEKVNTVSENLKNTQIQLISKIEEIKKHTNDIYTNLESSTNTKMDTKLQQVMEDISGFKLELSKVEPKLLKQNKKDILAETEKVKAEINEQITNNYTDTKAEFENMAESIEDIRHSMEETIETVSTEVLKLKKEIKHSLENKSNVEIEDLRKDYNKYATKVNNELAKISKDLLNAQKKNQEQNRNLQVKIRAYIDAKLEKSNNKEAIEELINNLSLSIIEREKLQKLEFEELLNKKIKAIQKENERMINKKIEEMSARFIKENKANARPIQNTVTLYEEAPTKKKSMYNIIDDKQMLKRSAASKNPSLPTKESKSQILKFFYDDEDEF